jgi:glycosyltransferase involved in cell wall biosynthesis
MNILILNWRDKSHPKSGGAEIVTFEHARHWVKMGHHVTWLTSWYDGALHTERIDGFTIQRRLGSLKIYVYVPWHLLFHGKEYDVIVDEVHGIPFFSPFFTSTPVVMFIHEIAGEIWDFMYPFPINVVGKLLESLYFRIYRSHKIWTDAPSMVSEIIKRGIEEKNCIAIPCPISVDRKNSTHLMGYEKEKSPTYIFVSRVVKMKGIEEVIKAFSFIRKEQKNARLWIIGSGEISYIEELQLMMKEYGILDRTTFLGKVTEKEKFEYMSKAHLLLHASVKEGWGLVVLEAAYAGTPSIVYNVPGLRDVVHDKETGIVIPDNSPMEMAQAAVRLIEDKKRYESMRVKGRAWVDSLKWDDVAIKSIQVLKSAIKQST